MRRRSKKYWVLARIGQISRYFDLTNRFELKIKIGQISPYLDLTNRFGLKIKRSILMQICKLSLESKTCKVFLLQFESFAKQSQYCFVTFPYFEHVQIQPSSSSFRSLLSSFSFSSSSWWKFADYESMSMMNMTGGGRVGKPITYFVKGGLDDD